MKAVKLKTIEDIFDNINFENYERFLDDFILFTEYSLHMRDMNEGLKVNAMEWKDDGINEITGFNVEFTK